MKGHREGYKGDKRGGKVGRLKKEKWNVKREETRNERKSRRELKEEQTNCREFRYIQGVQKCIHKISGIRTQQMTMRRAER